MPGAGAIPVRISRMLLVIIKPAQVVPVPVVAAAAIRVVAAAEIGAAGHIPGAPGTASADRRRFRLRHPLGRRNGRRRTRGRSGLAAPAGQRARPPVHFPEDRRAANTDPNMPGIPVSRNAVAVIAAPAAPIAAKQGAGRPSRRQIRATGIGLRRAAADSEPLDPLSPPPFLFRKLKNAVNANAGNAGFSVGQPALLSGDKAAENAAFPGIDGVVPFIAVFAGGPGFGFAESVGLVDAAVEGFAPVFGQGFEDGGFPVLVDKGLPVGTVPGDRPGLRRGCPPPPPPPIKAIISNKAIAPATLRRDIAIPSRMQLWLLALPIGYYAGQGGVNRPGTAISGNLRLGPGSAGLTGGLAEGQGFALPANSSLTDPQISG